MDFNPNKEKKDNREVVMVASLWNDDLEKVVINIGNSCHHYRNICAELGERDGTRYDALMYCLLALGPMTGSISALATSNPTYVEALQIAVTVLSMITALLSAIIKFSKLDQRAVSYKTVSAKFTSLYDNIQRQLSLSRSDRANPGKYLEWICTSYDELFAVMSVLPNVLTKNVPEKVVVTGPLQVGGTIKAPITPGQDIIIDLNRYADGKMRYEMSRLESFTQKRETNPV